MEYLARGSLRAALDDESGAITGALQRIWSSDVALGMKYLYEQGVQHRDLKPLNILLTRDLRAKVADFGLSTCEELRTARTSRTTRNGGKIAGTAAFMAPELLDENTFTEKSDVYELCCRAVGDPRPRHPMAGPQYGPDQSKGRQWQKTSHPGRNAQRAARAHGPRLGPGPGRTAELRRHLQATPGDDAARRFDHRPLAPAGAGASARTDYFDARRGESTMYHTATGRPRGESTAYHTAIGRPQWIGSGIFDVNRFGAEAPLLAPEETRRRRVTLKRRRPKRRRPATSPAAGRRAGRSPPAPAPAAAPAAAGRARRRQARPTASQEDARQRRAGRGATRAQCAGSGGTRARADGASARARLRGVDEKLVLSPEDEGGSSRSLRQHNVAEACASLGSGRLGGDARSRRRRLRQGEMSGQIRRRRILDAGRGGGRGCEGQRGCGTRRGRDVGSWKAALARPAPAPAPAPAEERFAPAAGRRAPAGRISEVVAFGPHS